MLQPVQSEKDTRKLGASNSSTKKLTLLSADEEWAEVKSKPAKSAAEDTAGKGHD